MFVYNTIQHFSLIHDAVCLIKAHVAVHDVFTYNEMLLERIFVYITYNNI